MTWNLNGVPADGVTVATGKRSNVFYVGEAITLTLTGAQPAGYLVRDYWGTTVAAGSCTVPGTLTLPVLGAGWYRVYFTRSVSDPTWGLSAGEANIAVLRTTTGFPTRPATGTSGGSNPDAPDLVARGLALAGPWRHQIDSATAPTTGTRPLSIASADMALEQTWYTAYDTARAKAQFCQFPNGTTGGASATTGIASVVAALGPIWYESRNEPNTVSMTGAQMATELAQFRSDVKAANASAKVLGPCPSTVNSGAGWMSDFLVAGGGASLDGISWHDYNSVNGDIATGRTTYDALVALLTKYGAQNLPRFMTEWGTFAASYGSFTPRRQARWLMMSLLMWEQYSIPKEHVFWFYDTSHGFWSFPSFWQSGDGSLYPALVAMRVWSEEVYGKNHAARLDFGTVENNHYIGSRFDGADGTSVVALLAQGRTDGTVTLQITGASTLTRVDAMGGSTTITVANGLAAIPVTETTCYVRIPAGATATVVAVVYGRNVFMDSEPPLASVSTGSAGSDKISNANVTSGAVFAAATNTLPATLTITFDNPLSFDRVVVRCPAPWQNSGTLTDYDLQYLNSDGSTWTTVETVTEPERTYAWVSSINLGACFTDSYFSGRHHFVHTLAMPVRSKAVRLSIRAVTKGGEPTLVDTVNNGQGNTAGTIMNMVRIEGYNHSEAVF